ncbi:unnamed protein product, partial [Laminaria digitata]
MLEGNQAGERGGALYATRGARAKWYACHSSMNSASLGAAVYASHSVVELREGSTLSYDEVPTGAMIYALTTVLIAEEAEFVTSDSPSMLAVQ